MLCTLLRHVQSSKGYSYLFLSCVIWGCFSSNLLLRRNPLFSSKIVARRSAVRYQEIGAAQTARPGGRAWCGALLCAVIFGAEQVKRRGGKPLSSRVTPPQMGTTHVTWPCRTPVRPRQLFLHRTFIVWKTLQKNARHAQCRGEDDEGVAQHPPPKLKTFSRKFWCWWKGGTESTIISYVSPSCFELLNW